MFLIKTRPQALNVGSDYIFEERALYGGSRATVGDGIYIYFSQTQGGDALAGFGRIVRRSNSSNGNSVVVTERISDLAARHLGNEQLKPYRDIRDGSPLSEVARKLYFQAHNKIVMLSEEEDRYIAGYFDEALGEQLTRV